MAKHTAYDLKQMQSLPLEQKILMTQNQIREWYDHWQGDIYVSFSGGKDSTVLKHIVDGMYDDIPSVFVNTGLEYPEIQKFVRDVKSGKFDCFNSDVEIIRPDMRFDEVIRVYGYPVISKEIAEKLEYARKGRQWALNCMDGLDKLGNQSDFRKMFVKYRYLVNAPFDISNKCCNVLKKKPVKAYAKETGRKPMIGTMASESTRRRQAWEKNGCNAFNVKRPISQPMAFWTDQDVLHYIKRFNVPYCTAYGDIQVAQHDTIEGQMSIIDYLGDYEPEDILETTGCTRTGCMFCMFGCHLEKEPNRFQRMKQTHPKQYAYCMEKLGLREVLDYIGVPYE